MTVVTEITQWVSVDGVALETSGVTLAVSTAAGQLRGRPGADGVTQDLTPINLKVAQVEAEVDAIKADPINAVTAWEIPAKAFDLVQGSASYIAAASRLGAWSMPNGSASYIATLLALPSHWRMMDVYVKWVNTVANNGNVVLGGEIHKFAMGESINVTPIGGSGTQVAVATPWTPKESKVAADLVVDASRLTILRVARQGLSGNDSLQNAIAIISIRLVKKL